MPIIDVQGEVYNLASNGPIRSSGAPPQKSVECTALFLSRYKHGLPDGSNVQNTAKDASVCSANNGRISSLPR